MTGILQFPATTPVDDAALIESTVAQWNLWGGFVAWKAVDPKYATQLIAKSIWKKHLTLPLWWVNFNEVNMLIANIGRASIIGSLIGTSIVRVDDVDLVALGYIQPIPART